MRLRTALRLGRVSNLPTVWTDAMAGAALAGAAEAGPVALAALSLSLSYVGGMWLNDAFDADHDAALRAARPIPAGEAARPAVFAGGFAMLAGGVALAAPLGLAALACALALAGAVVLYDWLHKRTALSPLLMGATRFLALCLGAFAAAGPNAGVLIGAAGLFALVVGLSYAAKQEAYDRIGAAWPLAVLAVPVLIALAAAFDDSRAAPLALGLAAALAAALRLLLRRAPGDVPQAVTLMIASIALYDGALAAGSGAPGFAILCAAGFFLTRRLQRSVPGT
jgi:4-hydroxybenzoate polyprenyltransferase